MFNIRDGIFETNSSSSHAICLSKRDTYNYHFSDVTEDNFIKFTMGQYGWHGDDCDTPQEKLNYILTMIICALQVDSREKDSAVSVEEIIESDDYTKLYQCIKENTKYEGICFCQESYNCDDGYVDHQSLYSHIDDFLNDFGVSLKDYLFCDKYFVVITNDNE